MAAAASLPPGVTVFERGWLSSNNVFFEGREAFALVDSGYCTHSQQTIALVRQGLRGRALELLVNTHLHSDHCGGNAALQAAFPAIQTLIPPGHAAYVREWDPVALTYVPTGQQCPRFRMDGVLQPGTEIALADRPWQIHAAPGHDPHSVILFEPQSGTLISADALWENGFGVVFPELEGEHAFDDVAATLDLIERLRPAVVVPGHGKLFTAEQDGVAAALARARSRLAGFMKEPARHARHAAKVLLKFKLLELQRLPYREFEAWALGTPFLQTMVARYYGEQDPAAWVLSLAQELTKSGAAAMLGDDIVNA
jgi:glyoxylase-like metal-dependent hydrolase (beta-lactamase superfamily II)